MNKINMEEFICHGLSGFKGDFGDIELQPQFEEVINYIKEPMKSDMLQISECTSHPEIIFSLFRLQQILQFKEISTLKALKEKEGSVIINSGKTLGAFNSENEICFAMKKQDFYPKNFDICFSNDAGDAFQKFITCGFSIMLPKDSTFDSYKRSANLDGVFHDEIRIEGSIKDPNIRAICVPILNKLRFGKEEKVLNQFNDYCKIVKIVRKMLDCYGYSDVQIFDSSFGYNLEWNTTIETFKKCIEESQEIRKLYWSGGKDYEFESHIENAMKKEIEREMVR